MMNILVVSNKKYIMISQCLILSTDYIIKFYNHSVLFSKFLNKFDVTFWITISYCYLYFYLVFSLIYYILTDYRLSLTL